MTAKPTTREPQSGPCIGPCGKILDSGAYCFGCRAFICDDCDQAPLGMMGPHPQEVHLGEGEDEEDGE